MDTDASYLGYVMRVATRDQRPVAELRPQFVSVDGTQHWRALADPEIAANFPNTGLVSWLDKVDGERSCWAFRVTEQRTFVSTNRHHEKYKVTGVPKRLTEVIDLAPLGGIEVAREQLTTRGLEVAALPDETAYALGSDGFLYGPLRLVRKAERVWLDEGKGGAEPVAVHRIPAGDLLRFGGPPKRIVLAPSASLTLVGHVDWAENFVVLKRVLRDVRRRDKQYTDTLKLTNAAIDRAADVLRVGSSDVDLERQRLERVRAFLPKVTSQAELDTEVMDEVLKAPEVEQRITEAIEQAKAAAVEAVKEEQGVLLKELQSLRDELTELKAEATTTEGQLIELRKQAEIELREIEAQFRARIQQLIAQPGSVLADLALQRLIGPAPPNVVTHPESERPIQQGRDWWNRTESSSQPALVESKNVSAAVRTHMRSAGFQSRRGGLLHSVFLSGLMPVVMGDRAYEFIRAYASGIAGGRCLWLPVSSTAADYETLLGTREASLVLFDALREAEAFDGPSVIVLDGINRAPVEACVWPVLDVYFDARHRVNNRALLVTDAAGHRRWFAWPRKALLAATVVPGPSTIRPPNDFWSRAVLIDCEGTPNEEATAAQMTEDGLAQVPMQAWISLEESQPRPDDRFSSLLADLSRSGLSLSTRLISSSNAVAARFSSWHPSQTTRYTDLLCACVAPTWTSPDVDLASEALSIAQIDTDFVRKAVTRINSFLG